MLHNQLLRKLQNDKNRSSHWKKFLENTHSWNFSVVVSRNGGFCLTSNGNLQNHTISRLLEECYLYTSMRKLITKICWIILLLYLLFFNANTELKQQSRAIIREKPTSCMQKKTITKSLKPVFYYNNSSATHRLILSGDIKTNSGLANRDNQQTKPKESTNKLQEVDVYSLQKLGAITMLHLESYPYHKKLS